MKIFVSVGTDVHRFDRLIDWVESWSADHPDDEILVQYGTSRAPTSVEGVTLLGREAMQRALGDADLVVVSCGPGGVMDARRRGRLPIVVARRADLAEHVDDHQLAFAAHLNRVGLARSADDERQFRALLQEAKDDPDHFVMIPDTAVPTGIAEVGRLVDRLVTGT